MSEERQRVNASLPAGLLAAFDDYCRAHGLNRSEAMRVAISRMLAKPPKPQEREAAAVATGAAAHRKTG